MIKKHLEASEEHSAATWQHYASHLMDN